MAYRQPPLIRPGRAEDAAACAALDLSYSTTYVCQLEARRVGSGGWASTLRADTVPILQADAEWHVSFRITRLPRSLELVAESGVPSQDVAARGLWLVAESDGRPVGYLTLWGRPEQRFGYLQMVAVHRPYRRRGIGLGLLGEARHWAELQGLVRLLTDVPARNFAAICLLQEVGFSLCGYNDSYYPNGEIALLFSATLRR